MSNELLSLEAPDQGVLFVVSGPSGVGKSTLLKRVMARVPGLEFSVSATTRGPREGEQDGVDYHFLTPDRFGALVAEDAFLEHATVYDRRYGTLRAPTQNALDAGVSLILDIDVQGAAEVRISMPDAVHLMVIPPSVEHLRARLTARGTDSAEVIERRMALVQQQLGQLGRYDYLVMNDDLDAAVATFQAVLLAELSRTRRRKSWVQRFH